MAVTAETLRLVRRLRVTVGAEADDATRALAKAWVQAWNELAAQWAQAADDITALQVELGRAPAAWELSRLDRLRKVLDQTERALIRLAEQTGGTVTDAAGRAVTATVQAEPAILASQLPATERAAAAIAFDRLPTAAVEAIITRTTQQITATTRPLSAAAYQAVQRELVRAVAAGTNPRQTSRRIITRTEGGFNGGLSRALNIARTETVDAYRTASRASHTANRDVVAEFQWLATLDRRTCVSCVAMHGTTFAVDEFGPADHQQGRCARVAVLRPWRELGINLDEPAAAFPDARGWFAALPETDQIAMMGRTRHDLWRTGAVGWDDLVTRRTTPGWRTSYTPRAVTDLRRRADIAA